MRYRNSRRTPHPDHARSYTPMSTPVFALARAILFVAALFAVLTGPARAGSGQVNSDGTIDVTLNFRFPPTQADIDTAKQQVIDASHVLWDATEGQLRFGQVTLTCGSVNEDQADMWVFAQPGRAGVSFISDGSGLGQAGRHVNQYLPSSTGIVIAHEFAHLALGLGDEYSEQNRFGGCWGFGRCMDSGINEQNQCLMQQPGGVSQTEFCVAANHDPLVGNNASCLVNPPDANGAPCATNCQFWNTTTLLYETTQQTSIHNEACWQTLRDNFSFLTIPAGLPASAEPGGYTDPTFIENCGATNTVLLVLDKSGSMAWNVNNDAGEVCGNGLDDDNDGSVDESADCGQARIEFVKASARAFLDLANGQGVRAGIVQFDGTPLALSNFIEVDGTSINTLKGDVDSLTPGGCTAIGDALTYSKAIFDLDTVAEDNKTAFLLTDGFNTCGSDPNAAAGLLQSAGIRVFTIPTGDASNDPTLTEIAGTTGGTQVDASDASALVAAWVQQWANYTNGGVIIPKMPYSVDARANISEPDKNVRTPASWSRGMDGSVLVDGLIPRNNRVRFLVADGTEKLSLVLAGNMGNMSGFGVRAELTAPDGTTFDSEAPGSDMRVVRDGFYLLVEVRGPKAGAWYLNVTAPPGAEPRQTGNITIISDNPRADFFASLDRHVVSDPSRPLRLDLVPIFHSTLRNVQWDVRVKRPDGTFENIIVESDSDMGNHFAKIASFPFKGVYEVRMRMRTTADTWNDPGEAIWEDAPETKVPVPEYDQTKALYFYVPDGKPVCPSDNPRDCDGDGVPDIYDTCERDTDKDGLPDCRDTDSDNDEIPDANEWRGQPTDLDRDGDPDHMDPDADGDGVFDAVDPSIGPRRPGDVNGDGDANILDVAAILRRAGGLDVTWPGDVPVGDAEIQITPSHLTLLDAVALLRDILRPTGGSVARTPNNAFSEYGVYLNHPALNGDPEADIVVCHRRVNVNNPTVGVWYDAGAARWVIYNEDRSPMADGEAFNYVYGKNVFRVARTAVNDELSSGVRLDHPYLNGVPGAVALTTHSFVRAYNKSPLGLLYAKSAWYAVNEDKAAMVNGESYNFAVSSGWGGALVAGRGNRAAANAVFLDDPRLNDNPKAIVLAQHALRPDLNPSPVGVAYDAGKARWVAYNETPGIPLADGEAIHYLIVP